MTTCDQARDAAPELALGILDGAERAALLRHLSTCPACREDTARLVETADSIGLLATPILPPVGFEDRVLAAMGIASVKPARRRRWFVTGGALLAAAVIGALLAIGGVLLFRDGAPGVTTAAMLGGGQTLGHAFVSPGDPPLVTVSMEYPFSGNFHLQAIRSNGDVDALGDLVSVNGAWRWSGMAKAGHLRALRVVDDSGNVTCEARLT